MNEAQAVKDADKKANEERKKGEVKQWHDLNRMKIQLNAQNRKDERELERQNIKRYEQYLTDLKQEEKRAKAIRNKAYKDDLNAQVREKIDAQVRSMTKLNNREQGFLGADKSAGLIIQNSKEVRGKFSPVKN